MFIRYWTEITPEPTPEPSLANIGYEFFKILYQAGIKLRVIPLFPQTFDPSVHKFSFQYDQGRWSEFDSEVFMNQIPPVYYNVVCGPVFEFMAKYTPEAKANIAIAAFLRPHEALQFLQKYDLVWAPRIDDATLLFSNGLSHAGSLPGPEIVQAVIESL